MSWSVFLMDLLDLSYGCFSQLFCLDDILVLEY